MTLNPDSAVIAYCAPGLKEHAARLLDAQGEVYREIIEHPWMPGRTDVILATDPDWSWAVAQPVQTRDRP